MHRLTGLGVVFFLFIHVIDTSWAVFAPEAYNHAIAIYQTPLFTLGEFVLVFAVVYHALNGLRISIFDFKPEWWQHQKRAAYYVLGGTALILVPVFIGMAAHVVEHYRHDPEILPLGEVLISQIPFVVGAIVAVIAAVILSFGVEQWRASQGKTEKAAPPKAQASAIEKFWWSFMRVSGVLIIPLVFGHLAMMHVLQGVFDLTAAGAPVVGTNAINVSGTAVEFVAHRWNHLVAGVAVWRVYDAALLILVTVHGFNGLRYVLTDYTMDNPMLRRASVYLTIMGGAGLVTVGLLALIGTVPAEAYQMAEEAARAITTGN